VAVIGCELSFVSQERLVISAATTYSTGGTLRNISDLTKNRHHRSSARRFLCG